MDETRYDECLSCRYSPVKVTQHTADDGEKKWVCDLCANNHVGMAVEYAGNYRHEDIVVLQTLNYNTNRLLEQLTSAGKATGMPSALTGERDEAVSSLHEALACLVAYVEEPELFDKDAELTAAKAALSATDHLR